MRGPLWAVEKPSEGLVELRMKGENWTGAREAVRLMADTPAGGIALQCYGVRDDLRIPAPLFFGPAGPQRRSPAAGRSWLPSWWWRPLRWFGRGTVLANAV
jgi:hypothetical protein